mgnify:FL=1
MYNVVRYSGKNRCTFFALGFESVLLYTFFLHKIKLYAIVKIRKHISKWLHKFLNKPDRFLNFGSS